MLILALGAGVSGWGRVVGNWKTEVTLRPEMTSVNATPMDFAGSSALIIGYFEGALAESPSRALSRLFLTDPSFTGLGSALQIVMQIPFMQSELSGAVFHLEGYHKQKIIIDYPVGTLGVRFDLALSPEESVKYLWKEVFVSYGGVSFTGRLSLMPLLTGLASGMGLKLRGNTFGGASVTVDSQFGLTTEIEEIQEGLGPIALPSFAQWKNTELSLTGLKLDWLHFDTSAKVSGESGYEYTKLDLQFEPEGWPVSFDLAAKFAPQTQSIRIQSTVDLEELGLPLEGVLYLYSRGLELRGFSLPYLEVDEATLSATVALKGTLYRARGSDIGLRAGNYYVDAALGDLKGYQRTDYVAVFSLEKSFGTADLGINLAGDIRFKRGDRGQSFEPGLLTGEITYDVGLSKQLAFGGGITIDPDTGLQELDLSIETWFYWY
jgi:hypothetical protein